MHYAQETSPLNTPTNFHKHMKCPIKSLKALCVILQHLPFNTSNEEDEVAVDFGAVDEFIDVAGVHCLSCLQAARPDAVAH